MLSIKSTSFVPSGV